jgi:hypothetical protein
MTHLGKRLNQVELIIKAKIGVLNWAQGMWEVLEAVWLVVGYRGVVAPIIANFKRLFLTSLNQFQILKRR